MVDVPDSVLNIIEELVQYRDGLVKVIKQCCQCRFEDGVRVQECHWHQCERSVRLPNGDPSKVTLLERIKKLEEFARDVSSNYDCDSDAHKYGTICRQCEALKVLTKEIVDE